MDAIIAATDDDTMDCAIDEYPVLLDPRFDSLVEQLALDANDAETAALILEAPEALAPSVRAAPVSRSA